MSMSTIDGPFVTLDDPDRQIRCQDNLHIAFNELVAKAVAAGWKELETLEAIADLADYKLSRLAANDDSSALRNILKKMY